MAHTDENDAPRKGRLSALQLLRGWLFDKRGGTRLSAETEFLNTRDGHELAKFAHKAFGQDAARHAQHAAVQAEQVQIDALLRGTGRASDAPAPPPATPAVAAADVMPRTPVELAVRQIELLRSQGLSVETLAEALIIVETREVKQRSGRAA
ncbi:MAG: hypothetical protein IT501_04185 [Rubrivivax sp.]|jgi:hypothetical protein|nr:hypothetical protein [Rubrivivax sp.]